jgi:hypothetical protein
MADRPIWRPNAYSKDKWNALSRDEQIQWWKRQAAPKSPPSPLKIVKLFERGIVTENHLCIAVLESLTDTNIREFVEGCPANILQVISHYAQKCPNDDDDTGWEQKMQIASTPYHPPWVTEDEIKQSRLETDRRFREGVRLLRHQLLRCGS